MRIPARGGWILAGALASFGLVLLHLGVIVGGAPAYAYLLAGENMVRLAEARSFIPTFVTGAIAAVFAVFGAYGLAGAGYLPLPGARILVAAIGSIYTLRGVLIVPEVLMVLHLGRPPRALVFSAVSLAIGIVHLVGVTRRWRLLDPQAVGRSDAV